MTVPASVGTGAAARPATPDPVLIVGAGPVGLVLACELLRRGVQPRVVDRAPGQVQGRPSKAILVWPRTLELVHGSGIAEEMTGSGHLLDGVRFYSDGRPLGAVHLTRLADTPYTNILMLPQWKTEQILLARLHALGGAVEWNTELVSVREEPDRAVAVLRRLDGAEETVRVPWLVGADGAHSTVRKLIGVPFNVTSPNATFAVGDCPVDGDLDERVLHYFYSRNGAMGVGPLGDRVFRFAVNIGPDEKPVRELFQAALDRRTGRTETFGRVGDPVWTAVFTVRCAVAGRFRAGRVFLVGDAAHVLSPAGGQGMNTGIQDAVNLAWKLAGVQLGRFRAQLLDSYDRERREAVAQVSASTSMQTRWGLIRTPAKAAARDALVRCAAATGVLQRGLAPLFSQTDLYYGPQRGSRFGRMWRYPQAVVGGRLPYLARLAGTAGGDGLMPALVLSRAGAEPARWSALRRRLLADLPADLPVIELDGAARSQDPTAALADLLGSKPAALLVRPDGHISAVAEAHAPEPIYAALQDLLAPAGVLGTAK
ncbi:FAD-dependent monooxygenase [Actinocrinis puniceicyclus]|uniref:FAD-dependent monooxygenase n=1 Tax=Actinocrinis puniceicyclus TaxID=977794 RepID=A0A8J7WRS6_9ACTN|nr:FAD-dependent monooxygenase [Actinocrinis puniceicyclus]MBS2964380.1 FAD-dependent monooxygenase [Actinocrinis puniceicyclus]